MTTHHAIAVAGAGLGGLTLANVLRRNGIDVSLYDLDASPAARGQGGMLDIHVETGQAALRDAGLFDGFERIIHAGGQETRVLDRHATVLHHGADDGGRPEVRRGDLRDLLLSGLPEGAIHWGSKIARASALGDGRHRVELDNGDDFTTDLLIGADGAWSRIRPLVSDAAPAYSGISFVELELLDAANRHPAPAELFGGGMLFALAPGKGILGHREPDGRLHLAVALSVAEDWLDSLDLSDVDAVKTELLGYLSDWDASLRGMVAAADGEVVPRRIHALPADHRWDHARGVTLLGDAAHLMSPFAGEGANAAMLDGARLATALLAHPDTDSAVEAYERQLFPRAATAAAESLEGMELCFGADTPTTLVAMFQRVPPQD
ncbi:MAG TPA: NAD(P)/FAD-dependent oxidoreductase [Stackebrandtia sp.]|jgi:2-polyprenyl-6-methoxyphenol hydroxylase-like FAD-dependent oxidoreductase|uniref:FAD-dependent oxidoreductase n=1 Tax=Stackebrandtia sp. TaxID=2023065 RepID=UPI002D2A7B7E|nr:NAD(P)/FAD-dependent oxidoreductase [Stackebrandtia sp.]HZE41385.1 NAD(P)/FAD-dependent oxidoreductase [Stackebrandtia sp.]